MTDTPIIDAVIRAGCNAGDKVLNAEPNSCGHVIEGKRCTSEDCSMFAA